jgi:outer membrane protein OmpA-like peptidoglycan-associated protein
MKKFQGIFFITVILAFMTAVPMSAQEADAEGCKDHPLFNRMPNYRIQRCEDKQFDSHIFVDDSHKEIAVEGQVYEIRYTLQEGAKEATRLQIFRNYQNAVTKIGGTVLSSDDDGNSYMKVIKDGKEIWVHVSAYITSEWMLYIVEKQAMTQEIVANAEAFANDIQATGHAAVYGIYFDTGKSEIKPESDQALAEIAKFLKKEPGLKLNVVGHTDSTGVMDVNMKLSQARAEAVVQVLLNKYGIAAGRLKGYGVGPLAPVASNDSEQGKAKNRRVELVKQ